MTRRRESRPMRGVPMCVSCHGVSEHFTRGDARDADHGDVQAGDLVAGPLALLQCLSRCDLRVAVERYKGNTIATRW